MKALGPPVPVGPSTTYSHLGCTRRWVRQPWHHLAHFIWEECILIKINSVSGQWLGRKVWVHELKHRNRHISASIIFSLLTLVFRCLLELQYQMNPGYSLLWHPVPLTGKLRELQLCVGRTGTNLNSNTLLWTPLLPQKAWHHLLREKLGTTGPD